MSAFEPHVPSDPKVDMPDFMVVLRGFDRRQVEMWAAEVASQIEQERLRADEAEKQLYRMQIDNKGAPSFSHLGSHVASILEEAGRSSENMLADAAERAQETIEAAEQEAADIIKASEHRAGEIEQEARSTLEAARAEGARVEEEALQAAEEMRAQAEQDARTVLEEARDATDMIWQEAERERLGVEAETIRLETLRHRSLEQLGRVYGHLESVLDEVRAGIGRVEEEEDEAEAAAAAAARLGVEPPATSPEDSPRFPSLPDGEHAGPGDDDGVLAATRPDNPAPAGPVTPSRAARHGDATGRPQQPVLPEATGGTDPSDDEDAATTQPTAPSGVGDAADRSAGSGAAETTQRSAGPGAAETTEQHAAAGDATQPVQASGATEEGGPPNGEGRGQDQDATQRLEPVGNNKASSPKPVTKEGKGRP